MDPKPEKATPADVAQPDEEADSTADVEAREAALLEDSEEREAAAREAVTRETVGRCSPSATGSGPRP